MLFLKTIKRLRRWLRSRSTVPIEHLADDERLADDARVRVIRIRLPSGAQLVIVKKAGSDE